MSSLLSLLVQKQISISQIASWSANRRRLNILTSLDLVTEILSTLGRQSQRDFNRWFLCWKSLTKRRRNRFRNARFAKKRPRTMIHQKRNVRKVYEHSCIEMREMPFSSKQMDRHIMFVLRSANWISFLFLVAQTKIYSSIINNFSFSLWGKFFTILFRFSKYLARNICREKSFLNSSQTVENCLKPTIFCAFNESGFESYSSHRSSTETSFLFEDLSGFLRNDVIILN